MELLMLSASKFKNETGKFPKRPLYNKIENKTTGDSQQPVRKSPAGLRQCGKAVPCVSTLKRNQL
jgi:hypothetical protein